MSQAGQGRRPRLLAAGLVVIVVTFVVAGVIGLRTRGPAPLPVAVDRLPRPTRFVTRTDLARAIADRHRMRDTDVPEQALWTALAERACGGYDLYRLLMDADREPERAAVALAQPVASHEQAIACGRALAERGGRRQGLYDLSFEDEGRARHVELIADGRDELPETVPQFRDTPAPGNLAAARCLVPWSGDRNDPCGDDARALGRLREDDAWAVGGLDELRAFGRAYALEVERDEEAFEALEDLASDMASTPRSVVGLAAGFDHRFTEVLDLPVSMHGEPQTRALVAAVREGAVVWGMQGPPPGGPGSLRIVVVAVDEAQAERIAAGWADYLERLRRELSARKDEPAEPTSTDEASMELAAARAAEAAVSRRAVDEAKIVVERRRVELEAILAPNAAEKAALAAHRDRLAARAALAAAAVDAMAAGAPPAEQDLVELAGAAFLRAVEVQRAVVAGGWPFEPEAWPEMSDFYVPGRGHYGTEYLDTSEVAVYTYPMPRSVLRRVFADVARAKGWQVRRGATANLYELSHGERRVRVLLGGRTADTSAAPDGAATSSLVLFPQP